MLGCNCQCPTWGRPITSHPVSVYTKTNSHTLIHTFTQVHTHIYPPTHSHTQIHSHIHSLIYIHTHSHIHSFRYMHAFTHSFVLIHSCTHSFIHSHSHTHVFTLHTLKHSFRPHLFTLTHSFLHTHTCTHSGSHIPHLLPLAERQARLGPELRCSCRDGDSDGNWAAAGSGCTDTFYQGQPELLLHPGDLLIGPWVLRGNVNPFSRRVCQEYKLIKQD